MIEYNELLKEFKSLNAKKRSDPGSLSEEERLRWKEMRRKIEEALFQSSPEAASDTREFLRVPTALSVRYWTRNELKDRYMPVLGEGGLFVSTVDPLPVDSEIDLEIVLQQKGLTVKVKGLVVWSNNKGDPAKQGMGIKFVEMTYEEKRLVYDLVDDSLRQSFLERRKFARVDAHLQVKFVFAEGIFELQTEDMSLGGVFIATDHLVPVGEKIRLVLHIPGEKPVIKALGEVVRVVEEETDGEPAGLGVRFVEWGPGGEKAIRKYLSEQVTQSIETSNAQRRRHPRLERLVKLRFQTTDSFKSAVARDISNGGVFIQTQDPPPVGAQIGVSIVHPTTLQKLNLIGRVVRVVSESESDSKKIAGVGVCFEEVSDENADLLQQFLRDFALMNNESVSEDVKE
jgi:uncharacterized protein (TIGR02266 family)